MQWPLSASNPAIASLLTSSVKSEQQHVTSTATSFQPDVDLKPSVEPTLAVAGEGQVAGARVLDASKIIYCPFSEEVKQQRYQQEGSQNFVCPECGQMFPSYNYLANHMVNHLPSETISKGPGDANKIHVCKVCNKAFGRSDMLTRHMRLHTGLRPYECRICGQVFSRSDHLHTHNRTHTGEKPYHCTHCPYAAPRRDMITRHMRIHMKQLPTSKSRAKRNSSTGSNDTAHSSSFSSQESGDTEAHLLSVKKHSSLSSVDSGELSPLPGASLLQVPGEEALVTSSGRLAKRVSLSALEHSHAAVETFARPRQWSARSESYETGDELTPSTPGSARRFFPPPPPSARHSQHFWPQAPAHLSTPSHSIASPDADQSLSSDVTTRPRIEVEPSSPKKRQWSDVSADTQPGESQSAKQTHDDVT